MYSGSVKATRATPRCRVEKIWHYWKALLFSVYFRVVAIENKTLDLLVRLIPKGRKAYLLRNIGDQSLDWLVVKVRK